ncbi:MAG: AtpZ/AtpI family protein [Lewinellaceae bacterium]|nr:AtpZ/AtpI family protein [Saprospiraceae bacterium]MCB9314633.1 AtpZ/AtpI family protein [Lewinellaceae bacterium]
MPHPNSPEEKRKSAIKDWARYSGLAFQLLGACLAGVFIGRWLDAKMQLERPLWAVFLTIFFMVASLVSLYRQLK